MVRDTGETGPVTSKTLVQATLPATVSRLLLVPYPLSRPSSPRTKSDTGLNETLTRSETENDLGSKGFTGFSHPLPRVGKDSKLQNPKERETLPSPTRLRHHRTNLESKAL